MSLKKSLIIIALILVVDQISKIYIKTSFILGEAHEVFSWFKILFIENEGAAWGTKLSDLLPISEPVGKLILTIFRIFAVFGIGYWLWDIIRKESRRTLILAVSLIFAGAVGNIIDSVFYGIIFDHSNGQVATLFADQPYGSLFHGKVVDMLYFPLVDTTWPDWVPSLGGKRFRFFEPVFNIADTAISTGVGILIVFNKKAFPKQADKKEEVADQNV
ncbi:MAG TPA: lipoprotein signal peptidase [Muricauda sp.]|uniref:Lipoprotein signal peptidase n=1 Tax=Flagellimonas aurea TaxID=2915619 RepID=A0ABS3FZH3_9FLAO|nr:lipoprotein signal peptidase [Allomuricauda aurea]MAO18177.1 lipoprotein signal peptidase [Allomuricauda sp.]MBO0352552.1 lipoprotein signal peptidase [Allomuricauda aurea]UBZ15564.1 lipoprotein signal peptidase [Allomuricauda aquimarina]HBU79661.1 lipoprotein signal peptidase [Allomuricauda sp.]|tara:strand:- start:1128 stop:1778 length:651 start_codon:yes stop_codon:yes gene_type:complete